jgi:hypothetical protein
VRDRGPLWTALIVCFERLRCALFFCEHRNTLIGQRCMRVWRAHTHTRLFICHQSDTRSDNTLTLSLFLSSSSSCLTIIFRSTCFCNHVDFFFLFSFFYIIGSPAHHGNGTRETTLGDTDREREDDAACIVWRLRVAFFFFVPIGGRGGGCMGERGRRRRGCRRWKAGMSGDAIKDAPERQCARARDCARKGGIQT